MRQLLPLGLSVITLWGMWLAGSHRASGWVVGIVNQVFWFAFIVAFDAWGLLPLNIALVVVYGRNLAKWRRDDPRSAERRAVRARWAEYEGRRP